MIGGARVLCKRSVVWKESHRKVIIIISKSPETERGKTDKGASIII
jgi:hypothetical protein